MELTRDLREFVELLNENDVQYLVVGGVAVNAYGYIRYTKDIDFWIWLNPDNAAKLVRTLKAFGMGSLGIQAEDITNPKQVIQLGYAPNRIDLIMNLDGLDFLKSYEKRKVQEIDGLSINLISREDLITAKLNAGRLQDLADVEKLRIVKEEE